MEQMNWTIKSFEELTTTELYNMLQLRSEVFVVEQNCPYQDLDDKDKIALHLWATDEEGKVVACCRLLPRNISYAEASIGRVATSETVRGTGAGRMLMSKAISHISIAWNEPAIRISAQTYLKAFYESLGFVQVGEGYLEDDIPHIEMLRKI